MNVVEETTHVTAMEHVIIRLVHTTVLAIWGFKEMDPFVKVSVSLLLICVQVFRKLVFIKLYVKFEWFSIALKCNTCNRQTFEYAPL